MDQVTVAAGKTRKTEQEIVGLMDAFNRGNVSVRAFCQSHDITTSSFHYWRKKYHRDANDKKVATGFFTLKVNPSTALFAEVGIIKVYQPVSAAYLRELVS